MPCPASSPEHTLRRLWAFKYDSRLSGIPIHADFAAVNVNFWVTPDEANLDQDSGGLIVWNKRMPPDWELWRYKDDIPAIRDFLSDEPGEIPGRALPAEPGGDVQLRPVPRDGAAQFPRRLREPADQCHHAVREAAERLTRSSILPPICIGTFASVQRMKHCREQRGQPVPPKISWNQPSIPWPSSLACASFSTNSRTELGHVKRIGIDGEPRMDIARAGQRTFRQAWSRRGLLTGMAALWTAAALGAWPRRAALAGGVG